MLKLVGYIKICLLVGLIGFSSWHANARNIGKIGVTYDVREENLLEVILKRLEQKIKNGGMDELNRQLEGNTKKYIERPAGTLLPRSQVYRAVEINAVYTLQKDIEDEKGGVLYKKGHKINPLEIKPLTKTLCFFDGDDREQVLWVMKYCATNIKNKLILINGNYLELSKEYKTKFYFDQYGYITKRLGIKAVPAVVRQNGKVLYVEEFPVN